MFQRILEFAGTRKQQFVLVVERFEVHNGMCSLRMCSENALLPPEWSPETKGDLTACAV